MPVKSATAEVLPAVPSFALSLVVEVVAVSLPVVVLVSLLPQATNANDEKAMTAIDKVLKEFFELIITVDFLIICKIKESC